jgi:UPF0755 protein
LSLSKTWTRSCPWFFNRRATRGAVLLLGVILLFTAGWFGWVFRYAKAPGPLVDTAQTVYIPPRTSFRGIEKLLASSGVIRADRRFFILARLSSLTNRLKAGEYRFASGMTPKEVLRLLEKGDSVKHVVTLPEGANLFRIAGILAENNLLDPESFLQAAMDKTLLRELGVEADSFEGYLFPDTYYLTRVQPPKEIIREMVERGRAVLAALGEVEKNQLNLSFHQIITLASIVEKETALPGERPLIARVFLNRLERGMRLQTDPTVIYGLENFDGNLTRRDLKSASPYNTYLVRGLPPGPIANPGKAAIEAVLYPAEGSYLYFVSKNDGSHHFSKSLKEHNRAVARYQKKQR